MSTAITEVQTAVAEFDKVAAGIAALKEQYAGVVYEVQTTKGMDEAKKARAAIREPRYEIERVRKEAKAPILKLGKELDTRAKAITEEILAIENPIHRQIENEQSRKEAEKQAKIDAELNRVADIQARRDAIRSWPMDAAGKPSSLVEQMVDDAEGYRVTTEMFAEFAEQAQAELEVARQALKGILSERREHEAEQERIKAEREELARLRAEAEKREAEERAEQERWRREKEDQAAAQRAQQEAELKAQREKQEAEAAAERKRIADEEAAAKAIRDAEAKKLADERAEFERQQAEARKAKEGAERIERERARVASLKKPADDELIRVLCDHYQAPESKVVGWLLAIDFSKREAA